MLLVDDSLARGASRSLLRAAEHNRARTYARIENARGLPRVKDQSSARGFFAGFVPRYLDLLILARMELAKRHSEVQALWFGTRPVKNGDAGNTELRTFFAFLSGGTESGQYDIGLRISRHAIDRLQQRKLGVLQSIGPVVDEFALCGLSYLARTRTTEDLDLNEFELPSPHGYLFCRRECELEFVGATWVPTEKLRPDQRQERLGRIYEAGAFVQAASSRQVRPETFAGRNDQVEILVRPSVLATFAKEKQALTTEGKDSFRLLQS